MGVRGLKKVVGVLALLAASIGWVGGPAGAASACEAVWGSLPRARAGMTGAPILAARAGGHVCYDRFVVELAGPVAGYGVRYVTQVTDVADGDPVPLRGGAFIEVVVRAPAYDRQGRPTYAPPRPSEAVATTGFRTFRQIAFGGSFEGVSIFGVGVRARLPFRVFVLPGPGTHGRLVIDVAHHW